MFPKKFKKSTAIFLILALLTTITPVGLFAETEPPPNVDVSKTYTVDADFDLGTFVGVEHNSVHDQLQLSKESLTLPFIWVPNNMGSASRVDTRTGKEIGRYLVAPPIPNPADPTKTIWSNPSRTTVDLDGSCWIGNRQAGTVVKIGLPEAGQWIDRNGNGICDTCQDLNADGVISGAEILPWGQDEAVLFEVSFVPGYEGTYTPGTYTGVYDTEYWGGAPRGLAVDKNNNVWVGTWSTGKYYYLDGKTGQILKTVDVNPYGHKAYGAVIDRKGILWSSSTYLNHILRIDTNTDPVSIQRLDFGQNCYGLALDNDGHLWVTSTGGQGPIDSKLFRINTTTLEKDLEIVSPNFYMAKGVAVTKDNDVWVATDDGEGFVYRYDHQGNHKATFNMNGKNLPDYQFHTTGVAVDTDGKVWVCGFGKEDIRRIDPATNAVDLRKVLPGTGGHYSYSDMTGIVARNLTTKIGTWTVTHDGGAENMPWKRLSWTSEEPVGTAVTVKVRSSNDQSNWSSWETVSNGIQLANTPNGRYLQVETKLQITAGENSPVLHDLTIVPDNSPPIISSDIDNVFVDEGQSALNSGVVIDPNNDTVTLTASVGTVVNNGNGTWSWSYITGDGPSQSQSVTITADDGGGKTNSTFALMVNNVAPNVGPIDAPAAPVPANTEVHVKADFTDPGTLDTPTAFWDWGDGTTSTGTVNEINGSGSVTGSHIYAAGSFYTVKVTVTDKDGATGQAEKQISVNSPPIIEADNPNVIVDEGETAVNSGIVFEPNNDPVTITASVGAVVNNGNGTWTWIYATGDGPVESQNVTIIADDGRGERSAATFALTVNNVIPVVGPIYAPTSTVPINSEVNVRADFTDPGILDTHTAICVWGDGTASPGIVSEVNGSGSVTGSHAYTAGGVYIVRVIVTDKDGGKNKSMQQVIVNSPPVISTDCPNIFLDEGQTALNSGMVIDPNNDTLTLTASVGTVVNNGNGTWTWSYPTGDGPAQSQNVTITADDGNGGKSTVTFGLTVNNVAPDVGPVDAPIDPVLIGTTVDVRADFTDPGTLDTHTAVWEWGDGTSSTGTLSEVNGSGSIIGSHAYAAAGVYIVKVTVTDKDGASAYSVSNYVVVYDPGAGFVTGGGWINSPTGAYVAEPGLTGKANFGFVSKYLKGATVPTGQTEFQFKVGNLNFHSTNYDWLVIAGAKAQYKGTGTINGSGEFGFMLTAIDGQINGGGDSDKFRIKIWDKATGSVVYDNQIGAGDTEEPTTVLSGGSIVIHKD